MSTVPPVVLLSVAVLIWCFSPLLVTLAKGTLPSFSVAALATFLASVVSFLIGAISGKKMFGEIKSTFLSPARIIRNIVLGILAFAIYPALYFVALQRGEPVAANLTNYLWPIIAILVVIVRSQSPITVELILGCAFAFSGAALSFFLAYQTGGGAEATGQLRIWPFASAFLGAVAYGAYSGFIRTPRSLLSSIPFLYADFLVMLGVSGFLVAPIVLGITVVRHGSLLSQLPPDSLLALLLYSLGMAIAHYCWLQGVSRSSSELPFISVYLVPVGSTLILAQQTNQLTIGYISALSLVLCGIYFALHEQRVLPVSGVVVIAVFASWQLSVVLAQRKGFAEPNSDALSILIGLLQLLAGIFAILSGFILTNAINRYNEMRKALLNVFTRIANLVSMLNDKTSADGILDDFVGRLVVRATESTIPTAKVEADTMPRRDLLSLLSPLEGVVKDGVPVVATQSAADLRTALGQFESALVNRVSRYEWTTIGLTTMLMLFLIHAIPSSSLLFALVRATLVASLIGIVAAIRDYDLNRPHSLPHFLIFAQHVAGITEGRPAFVVERAMKNFEGKPPSDPVQIISRELRKLKVVPPDSPEFRPRLALSEVIYWAVVLFSAILGIAMISDQLGY